MQHPCQVAAPFQILNARDNIAWLFVPFDGAIKKVSLGLLPGNENDNGDAVFDVTVNGVTVFPVEADRPKILSGELTGLVVGLDFAVVEGQLVFFHAKDIPLGGLQGPVMLQVTMDDGITSGLDAGAVTALINAFVMGGDLSGTPGAALVNQIKGRSLGGIPSAGGFLHDDFAGGVVDAANWTTPSGGLSQHDGHLWLADGAFLDSNVGLVNLTDRFIQWRWHAAAGWHITRVLWGNVAGADEYIQIWVRAGQDIRVGWRTTATGTIWFAGWNDNEKAHNEGLYTYFRVEHKTSTGKVHVYYSTTAAPGTWVEVGNIAPPVSIAETYLRVQDVGGGGGSWVDDVNSNWPASDPILGRDLWPLVWKNSDNQFQLLRMFGMIDLVGAAPSGPPAGWPAGKGWLGAQGNTLYMWDGAAMHSQVF